MKRLIAAGCLVLGFAGTSLRAAEDVSESDRLKYCREEVWHVYVPSRGPKWTRMARSQKRTVFVCDQPVVSQSTDEVSCNSIEEKDR